MQAVFVCILPMRNWNYDPWTSHAFILFAFVFYLWGIETTQPENRKQLFHLFVFYLWGIETDRAGGVNRRLYAFVFYLWGIETLVFRGWLQRIHPFVFYLWGIETTTSNKQPIDTSNVCILPMRNWNQPASLSVSKPWLAFVFYLWGIETRSQASIKPRWLVCILPMRNWNICCLKASRKLSRSFVFYLWGIETQSQPGTPPGRRPRLYFTYEELKQVSYLPKILPYPVCILPMRNWN